MQRLSAEPSECVFVGDHPLFDVHGARSVGMIAVWLRGSLPWPDHLTVPPDHTIDRIAELLPIVCGNRPPSA